MRVKMLKQNVETLCAQEETIKEQQEGEEAEVVEK